MGTTSQIKFIALLGIAALLEPVVYSQLVMPTVNIPNPRVCPDSEEDESLQQIRSNISDLLSGRDIALVPECGDGLWYQIAYLNMTDPLQQCPPAWREYNTSGVRACGRPVSSGCSTVIYPTKNPYSKVCGRVIGWQVGSPDGFFRYGDADINDYYGYLDGVSFTYGLPHMRNHIWSYVGGVTENSTDTIFSNCPCSVAAGAKSPSFVGENYYCESGNPDKAWYNSKEFYGSGDPLWDGEQCEGTCCSGTNSLPWFSVQLPNHTTDRIEVRICGDESTENEDTPVEQLEIYVQ